MIIALQKLYIDYNNGNTALVHLLYIHVKLSSVALMIVLIIHQRNVI